MHADAGSFSVCYYFTAAELARSTSKHGLSSANARRRRLIISSWKFTTLIFWICADRATKWREELCGIEARGQQEAVPSISRIWPAIGNTWEISAPFVREFPSRFFFFFFLRVMQELSCAKTRAIAVLFSWAICRVDFTSVLRPRMPRRRGYKRRWFSLRIVRTRYRYRTVLRPRVSFLFLFLFPLLFALTLVSRTARLSETIDVVNSCRLLSRWTLSLRLDSVHFDLHFR